MWKKVVVPRSHAAPLARTLAPAGAWTPVFLVCKGVQTAAKPSAARQGIAP